MPTRYHAAPWRPHAGRQAVWDSMYWALAPNAVRILQPTGFYERHDLEIPAVLEGRKLIGEEKVAIEAIATALTIAGIARTRPLPAWSQPGSVNLPRNRNCFGAMTCRPKYIGKSS